MTRKYRAQILLEPGQHTALAAIAEREGRSISEVAREVIDRGLDDLYHDAEATWRVRATALERLAEIRTHIERQHGVYGGDLLAEARAVRARELDQAKPYPTTSKTNYYSVTEAEQPQGDAVHHYYLAEQN